MGDVWAGHGRRAWLCPLSRDAPAELLPCPAPRALTDRPELLIFSTLRHFSTFCHLPSSAHHFYSCCRRNTPCLALEGERAGPWPPASTECRWGVTLCRGTHLPQPLHPSPVLAAGGTPMAPSYSRQFDLRVNTELASGLNSPSRRGALSSRYLLSSVNLAASREGGQANNSPKWCNKIPTKVAPLNHTRALALPPSAGVCPSTGWRVLGGLGPERWDAGAGVGGSTRVRSVLSLTKCHLSTSCSWSTPSLAKLAPVGDAAGHRLTWCPGMGGRWPVQPGCHGWGCQRGCSAHPGGSGPWGWLAGVAAPRCAGSPSAPHPVEH